MNIQNGSVVEYQQNSKSITGIVIGENKGKYEVFNETGNILFLPPNRLFVLGYAKEEARRDNASRQVFLKDLIAKAEGAAAGLNLEMAWEIFSEAGNKVAEQEFCELFFTDSGADSSTAQKLAVHRLLVDDKVFFKRDKSGTLFEARTLAIVEELKKKQITEAIKLKAQEKLVEAIIAALLRKESLKKGPNNINEPAAEFPPEIAILEQYAALGSKASSYKNAVSILEEVQKRAKLALNGRGEEKAFALLVKIGHFHKNENLSLYKVGRYTKFDLELEYAAEQLVETYNDHFEEGDFSDLTGLDIFSIDSATTKDIDDALSLERQDSGDCAWRIGMHITDVASFVLPDTELFNEAMFRASSLYFPEQKVHMLPQTLSEKACSLIDGKMRYAMTFFLYLDDNGEIKKREIVRSKIIIKTRLDYDIVDSLLAGDDNANQNAELEKLKPTLRFLLDFAKTSELERIKAGALVFQRRDMQPILLDNGRVGLVDNNEDTPSRKVVSELMVQANLTAALFARENYLPIIYRSQEPPHVDPKTLALDVPPGTARNFLQCVVMKKSATGVNPLPHIGLGLEVYTQATSPLRRAGDLINQKQIISFIKDSKPYFTAQEVLKLSGRIDESLIDAKTLQRERNRYWLLKYIIQEGWSEVEGTVLKTEGVKNPLVELDNIFLIWNFTPLEQKRLKGGGFANRPGERVTLKIKKIDADGLVMRLVEI